MTDDIGNSVTTHGMSLSGDEYDMDNLDSCSDLEDEEHIQNFLKRSSPHMVDEECACFEDDMCDFGSSPDGVNEECTRQDFSNVEVDKECTR